MSFVKRAHGGYKADGAVVLELFAPPLAEGGNCTEDFDSRIGNRDVFASGEEVFGGRERAWYAEELWESNVRPGEVFGGFEKHRDGFVFSFCEWNIDSK